MAKKPTGKGKKRKQPEVGQEKEKLAEVPSERVSDEPLKKKVLMCSMIPLTNIDNAACTCVHTITIICYVE